MSGFLSSMVGATYAPAITFANATGGTITTYTDAGKTYRVHRFTTGSNLVVTAPGLMDFLIVGGGGGGGGGSGFGGAEDAAGGGGAGQYLY